MEHCVLITLPMKRQEVRDKKRGNTLRYRWITYLYRTDRYWLGSFIAFPLAPSSAESLDGLPGGPGSPRPPEREFGRMFESLDLGQ